MAKKKFRKIRAIRAAVLSNTIITSPGWKKFQSVIDRRSMYSILTKNGRRLKNRYAANQLTKHYPGLGYLLFLEQALGISEFRKLCPLTLPIDDRLVTTFLSSESEFTKNDLHIKDVLCQFLFAHYCERQRSRAHRLWPSEIGPHIDQTLSQALPPALTKPIPWTLCQAFLSVRYGLSNTEPVIKIKKLALAVLHQASLNPQTDFDTGSFDGDKTVLSCTEQLNTAFQHPTVRPHLCNLAHTFSNSRKSVAAWKKIQQAALEQSSLTQTSPELNLDSFIYGLISVRAANALETIGIWIFRDLIGVSENRLLAITSFGDSGLRELRRALKQVLTAIEDKERAKQRQFKKEKKLARQNLS